MSLENTVREMRTLGRMLLPYSFPIVSNEDEADIAILKKRLIEIDGYEIFVYFNNADYGSRLLESLQIYGNNFTFLPFYLIIKLARAFLGDEALTLTETIYSLTGNFDDSCRKIYVWTLYYDVAGKRVEGPLHKNGVIETFEGFKFTRIPIKDFKFF